MTPGKSERMDVANSEQPSLLMDANLLACLIDQIESDGPGGENNEMRERYRSEAATSSADSACGSDTAVKKSKKDHSASTLNKDLTILSEMSGFSTHQDLFLKSAIANLFH
jgi:hypothetical protein